MKQSFTIARRELTSLFLSPIAYVVLAIFAFGASAIFFLGFGSTAPATLRPTFDGVIWLMIFLVPAISMRLVTEEFRGGTIESLMTSPVTDTQVVVGKWLGAVGFFVTLLLPLVVVMVLILEVYGKPGPDYGPVLTGLLGVLLVAGLYLAIGTFASTITQNQIVAFIVTVFFICLLTVAMRLLPMWSWVGPQLQQVMHYINVENQFEEFNKGLIDLTNFVYFVSGIAFFLFLAVKLLESRRWR